MISSSGENSFIEWLRVNNPVTLGSVLKGIGDDCAVFQSDTPRPWLVTTDMLLEGSCFRLGEAGAYRIGRKSMSVNLSDIAAMAGIPCYAFVSVGLPQNADAELPKQLYWGLKEVADTFGVSLIGGDTNSWANDLVISVTVIGRATERGYVTRSGARRGDWIFVTGPLGGSILGKHIDFTPRITEAIQLHKQVDIHAMIDISDGLAKDLHHICKESRCGACLQSDKIPISDAAWKQSNQDSRSPLIHALSDGEDFELLFTVSPLDGENLIREQPIPGIQLHHIGEIIDREVWMEKDGVREILEPLGYEHSFGSQFG
jgi:thiamine-monophosphate kinase